MKTVYGSVVAVVNDSKILILRKSPTETDAGLWQFVCGTYETSDHTLLHTALRELPEETGLMVNRLKYIGEIQKRIDNVSYVGNVYLAQSGGSSISISREHDRIKWINRHQLNDYEFDDGTRLAMALLF